MKKRRYTAQRKDNGPVSKLNEHVCKSCAVPLSSTVTSAEKAPEAVVPLMAVSADIDKNPVGP